jgi:PKD repeat protein
VAAFTANTVSGSGPLLVSFMDQSQGVPTSWTWYFGDGQTSIEQNPKHTYTQQGTYTVSLRAINANGANIATKGEFITITAEDKSAPKAAFTANIVTGKAPLTVSFMDKSLGSPTSWTWYFGDGQTSTDRNPKHTYTKPGTYTVSLRAINAKGTDIKTQQGFITVT